MSEERSPSAAAPAVDAVAPPAEAATGAEVVSSSSAAPAKRRGMGERVLPVLASGFIRTLAATLRFVHHGDQPMRDHQRDGRRFILTFWHRHLMLMPYAYLGSAITVMISASRDGELIARTIARFGVQSARGSSSRGGATALRELLRQARAGRDIAFTPDGPRGPACVVQPGVVMAAAATGLPIMPVAYAASRGKRLGSWDGFLVPAPFARVDMVYGEPLRVGRHDDQTAAAAELEKRLRRAEADACRWAGDVAGLRLLAALDRGAEASDRQGDS